MALARAVPVVLAMLLWATLLPGVAQELLPPADEVSVDQPTADGQATAEALPSDAFMEEAPSEVGVEAAPAAPAPVRVGPLTLTSTAFSAGASIPTVYSCDGTNISPPLAWTEPPTGTASLVLIMHDPDAPVAGGWTHWVVYDLPVSARALLENAPKSQRLDNGGVQGNSDFGTAVYGGPCPPRGDRPHTYHFTLDALSAKLNLAPGATRTQVLSAVKGLVLAEAELTGTYRR